MNKHTKKKINIPLTIIATVAGGVALIHLKSVLMPLVVAFFLVNLAGPCMSFLKKKGTPTGFAVLLLIAGTGLAVFLLARIFYTQVPELIDKIPQYHEAFLEKADELQNRMPEKIKEAVKVNWKEAMPAKNVSMLVASWLGDLFGVLGTMLLILLFMIFLLLEREQLMFRVKQAYDSADGERILKAVENIQKQTENYIVGKTFTSLITGMLFTILLWFFGVKFFFVWGLLAFLLNFIPNIGSCIATAIPILVMVLDMALAAMEGAADSFSILKIASLALCLIIVQICVGSFFEPKLLGEKLKLSPLVVFCSFIMWGWLWGLPGMILAIPIMATIKIIFENVDGLKPLAVLISNRRAGGK